MRILIKATNIKLDKSVYDYIEEKIGGLGKFLKNTEPDLIKARVEVGKTTNHHQRGDIWRAEINLGLPGRLLRAEAEREDIFMAITDIKDEIQRQIKKYKQKPKRIKNL